MDDIVEMEGFLRVLDRKAEIARERLKELNRLSEMPFHLRLQDDTLKEELADFEKNQKHTFKVIIKRYHEHLINEVDDLFAEYFMSFLAGKSKSINDFLYEDRLAAAGKRKLKV